MGDKFGGAVDPLGITGSNPVARALGLGGEQGEYATANHDVLKAQKARADAASGDRANAAVRNYGVEGSRSLNDTLSELNSDNALSGNEVNGITNRLATDPLSGTRMATDQVQNNGILGGLFGKGGQLDKTMALNDKLQNQGYALTPEDHEAYGQASGDIARMFGQSEQSLGQSLADRGLAGGSNGAAGVGFSGLQGNKNEMLAKAQTDIADKRMQNTMQRIGQNNSLLSSLGSQANTAIQDQYSRQLAGVGQQDKQQAGNLAGESDANKADLASMEDKRGAKGKTLLEGLGAGLTSGVAGAGQQAPGMAMKAAMA